jgi:NTE family protein
VVNAASFAGNAPKRRIEHLRRFWSLVPSHPDDSASVVARKASAWASVLRTRVGGAPGHFVPRLIESSRGFISNYDLGPLKATLTRLIDFDLLNAGPLRYNLLTTDLETGEGVAFDTGRGDRIGLAPRVLRPEGSRASLALRLS